MRVSVSVSAWAWEQNSNAKDLLGRGEVIAFQLTGLNLISILRFSPLIGAHLLRWRTGTDPQVSRHIFVLKTDPLRRFCGDGILRIGAKIANFALIEMAPAFSPGPRRTRHSGAIIDVR